MKPKRIIKTKQNAETKVEDNEAGRGEREELARRPETAMLLRFMKRETALREPLDMKPRPDHHHLSLRGETLTWKQQ